MKSPFKRRSKPKARYGELDSSSEHTELEMTEEFRIIPKALLRQDIESMLDYDSEHSSMCSSGSQFDKVSLRILQKENDIDEDTEHSKEGTRVRRTVELRKSISEANFATPSSHKHSLSTSLRNIILDPDEIETPTESPGYLSEAKRRKKSSKLRRNELFSDSKAKLGSKRRSTMDHVSSSFSTPHKSKPNTLKDHIKKTLSSGRRKGSGSNSIVSMEEPTKGPSPRSSSRRRRHISMTGRVSDSQSVASVEEQIKERIPKSSSSRRRRASMDHMAEYKNDPNKEDALKERKPRSLSNRPRRTSMDHSCSTPSKEETLKEQRPRSASNRPRKGSMDLSTSNCKKEETLKEQSPRSASGRRRRTSMDHVSSQNSTVRKEENMKEHRRHRASMDHSNSSGRKERRRQTSKTPRSDRDEKKKKKTLDQFQQDEDKTKRTSNRYRRSSMDLVAGTEKSFGQPLRSQSAQNLVSPRSDHNIRKMHDSNASLFSRSGHERFAMQDSNQSLNVQASSDEESTRVLTSSYLQLDVAAAYSEEMGIKNHRRIVEP